jgi:hypothetical protein
MNTTAQVLAFVVCLAAVTSTSAEDCLDGNGSLFALHRPSDRITGDSVFSTLAKRRLDAFLDPAAFGTDGLLGAKHVAINLFDDVRVDATVLATEERTPHNKVWYGTIPGDPASHVIVTLTRGQYAVSVGHRGAHYLALPTLRGRHEIIEVDDSRLPLREDVPLGQTSYRRNEPTHVMLAREIESTGLKPKFDGPGIYKPWDPPRFEHAHAIDDRSSIDILVVYTQSAGKQLGPSPDVIVDQAVAFTNFSFIVSGIPTRLNLVTAPLEITMALDNIGQDLVALAANGEGYADGVHDLREYWAADLVVAFSSNDLQPVKTSPPGEYPPTYEMVNVCGLAFLHQSGLTPQENAARGFAVVTAGCSITRYSFTHEVGHLLGSAHDRATVHFLDKDDDDLGNVSGVKSTARGFVLPPSQGATTTYRSVMASEYLCVANKWSCSRLLRWSNANDLWFGRPFGVPDGFADSADNTARLNFHSSGDHILQDIANYRHSACRGNPGCL